MHALPMGIAGRTKWPLVTVFFFLLFYLSLFLSPQFTFLPEGVVLEFWIFKCLKKNKIGENKMHKIRWGENWGPPSPLGWFLSLLKMGRYLTHAAEIFAGVNGGLSRVKWAHTQEWVPSSAPAEILSKSVGIVIFPLLTANPSTPHPTIPPTQTKEFVNRPIAR